MAHALPPFEGRDVRRAQLILKKAGDGLSEALSLAPKPWSIGDEVFLVIKAVVTHVDHRPADKDTEDLARVHIADAMAVTEVNGADVMAFLNGAADRIRQAKEEASGQTNLLDGAPASEGIAGLGPESAFNPDDLPSADDIEKGARKRGRREDS